ncbi:MAG: hypothetical protein K9G38_02210 [Bacteroidales bacterium]|nr:hypothetical protein [Bacteroidales bacterium]
MKKILRLVTVVAVFSLLTVSCGVPGDPGHCYFSLNWEYYNEDYGVTYYEDNNPDIPESDQIVPDLWYECYPGRYEYSYEAQDPERYYYYTGYYILEQNPGTPGGFLHDGMDGADTFFPLYLYIINRKGLSADGALKSTVAGKRERERLNATISGEGVPAAAAVAEEQRSWVGTSGDWKLTVEEEVRIFEKVSGEVK